MHAHGASAGGTCAPGQAPPQHAQESEPTHEPEPETEAADQCDASSHHDLSTPGTAGRDDCHDGEPPKALIKNTPGITTNDYQSIHHDVYIRQERRVSGRPRQTSRATATGDRAPPFSLHLSLRLPERWRLVTTATSERSRPMCITPARRRGGCKVCVSFASNDGLHPPRRCATLSHLRRSRAWERLIHAGKWESVQERRALRRSSEGPRRRAAPSHRTSGQFTPESGSLFSLKVSPIGE